MERDGFAPFIFPVERARARYVADSLASRARICATAAVAHVLCIALCMYMCVLLLLLLAAFSWDEKCICREKERGGKNAAAFLAVSLALCMCVPAC